MKFYYYNLVFFWNTNVLKLNVNSLDLTIYFGKIKFFPGQKTFEFEKFWLEMVKLRHKPHFRWIKWLFYVCLTCSMSTLKHLDSVLSPTVFYQQTSGFQNYRVAFRFMNRVLFAGPSFISFLRVNMRVRHATLVKLNESLYFYHSNM